MNKTIRNIGVLVVSAFALVQGGEVWAADANPPERMTYQGYLVDGNGAALGDSVPANYDVIFRIYAAKQGGTALWAEQQTVTADKGYFSVLLGEGSQYGSELHGDLAAAFDGADASDRFIGITVDIGGVATEIAPRLRMVSSPFAFTATQARRLTDGSGNSNFAKVGTSLELGAGSTPTLTLPEAGGASLVGKLTADLPSWGTGLQIDNGSLTTTIGAANASYFHFTTGLPKFYFNTDVDVDGAIRSHGRDTILGPSNNTDTYLKIFSGSDDMHAYADSFYFRGGHDFKVNLGANTELLTGAPKFYMNKPLEVEGNLTVNGTISGTPGPVYLSGSQGLRSVTGQYGTVQTTGGGQSGWEGYSIDGRYVFMSDDDDHVGLYNDIDNQWLWDYNRSNNWHKWYNDGEWKMYLSSSDLYLSDGWFGRYSHHTGGLMGSYSTVGGNGSKTNPIYIIGSSYKPNEEDLNNMYGIGYTHPNASFITGNAAEWGMYVASAGTANAFISGYSVSGRSYIKSQRGGLGVGTDSPDTYAALTASGEASTLGYSSWPKSLYITNPNNNLGTISGPGRIAMGFHSNRAVYFIDEQEDHYTRIFYENGTVGTGSDIRLKKDIEPVNDVLDKLQEIRGVRYRYKADKETTRFNIGVIAQEVEKVFPELVNKMPSDPESDEEYMTVTYENITPILIEAVKELRVEKDEQLARKDERINELEQRLAKLEEMMTKIDPGQ